MKYIITIVLFFVAGSLKAQVMTGKAQWVTIKSANLRCWECKEKLEKYLVVENKSSFESGLIQWRINLLQGEIKIQYWPDRATPENIRVSMNNAGFDADSTKAEEDAYKKLPPICKRAEDGGGPQKSKPCHVPPYQP